MHVGCMDLHIIDLEVSLRSVEFAELVKNPLPLVQEQEVMEASSLFTSFIQIERPEEFFVPAWG